MRHLDRECITVRSGRDFVSEKISKNLIDVSEDEVDSSQGDRFEIEEGERDSVEQNTAPEPRKVDVSDARREKHREIRRNEATRNEQRTGEEYREHLADLLPHEQPTDSAGFACHIR